jgi:hypothetical protein
MIMQVIALLTVLVFAAPLLMLAAPFTVYIVPAFLIGLAISYWMHRRHARRLG